MGKTSLTLMQDVQLVNKRYPAQSIFVSGEQRRAHVYFEFHRVRFSERSMSNVTIRRQHKTPCKFSRYWGRLMKAGWTITTRGDPTV